MWTGFCHPDGCWSIEIINNTRKGIVMFSVKTKGNAAIGGQIPVPDVGPSANWLSQCLLNNSRNLYKMFSSPLFEVVLPGFGGKIVLFQLFLLF